MQRVILVVAHDASVRSEVSQALRGEGCLVLAVPDGTMALDVASHVPIALLIFDPMSPQPGGPALFRQLRALAETERIPLLTLVASTSEIAQVRQPGPQVEDVLLKPFQPDELRAHVQRLLRSELYLQKVLLVVEQDADTRGAIVSQLREEGYLVLAVPDRTLALDVARDNPVSLIVLDPISLHPDGLELCRQLRACTETARIPILLLVTSDLEIAQMMSSGLRVDDFLVKPFPQAELRACVQALLRIGRRSGRKKPSTGTSRRRIAAAGEREVLVAEDLRVDIGQHRVTQGDREIKLGSALLFDLLVYLLRHRGMVLTRDQLFQQVWGSESAVDSRTVDVHIHLLRQKLQDDPAHPRLIQTVPRVGYRFME